MQIIVLVLILLIILVAVPLVMKLSDRKTVKLDTFAYQQYWRKIGNLLREEQQCPLAVIEADKLLDKALKERRFTGSNMAERLVSAGKHFSDKEAVWQVHKLRNRLVHETDVSLSLEQARKALQVFEQALIDIGAF